MKCRACGFDIPPGFKFCGNCGAKSALQCPNCGGEVPEGFKFCGNCGTPLQSAAPPVVPPPAAITPEKIEAEDKTFLQDELKQVTVLFGDVSGFTAMSEKLQPEEVRLVMDACLKQLAEEVLRFGGTVDKFSGDNIMAVFGAPMAHEDDPERAVMAAIQMQQSLRRFSAELERKSGLTLQMRMGINSGPVVAGITGSERAKDYTVLGDAVNLAARLEQAAEKGKILVGENTFKATKELIEYQALPPILVKGKSQPVSIWEVVGLRAQPAPKRGIGGLQAPMVGRDDEFARLKAVFEAVLEKNRPHLVTVLGNAGAGKSRLALEFERYISGRASPVAVRKGQCLPYGSGMAFLPLAEILRAECGILDSDAHETAREKLLSAIRELFPVQAAAASRAEDPLQIFQRVAFAIGLESEGGLQEMDPKNIKEELFWGLRKFLERKAALRPLVLVLDDIHWADPSLLDFAEYLADRAGAVPLFLLALSRPELMDKRPSWGAYKKNHVSIFLEPLDKENSHRLIGELLQVEELPLRLKRAILTKAEGNPFYIEETLRMLIEEGILSQQAGIWRATQEVVEGRIPDSIQTLVAARIDRLDAGEKRVLQEAAVVGRVFWQGSLSHLAPDVAEEPLVSRLRGLQVRELVTEQDDSLLPGEKELSFNNILVRDVAYESVPRAKRGSKHTQVAQWIESKAGERLEDFVELLAYHWEQAAKVDLEMGALLGTEEGGMPTRRRAVDYLKLAGDKAKSRQSNIEASSLYQRALTILESILPQEGPGQDGLRDLHLHLLCNHAEVLEGLGEYEKAIHEMELVREKAQALGLSGLMAESLRLLSNLYRDKGDLSQAEGIALSALEHFEGESGKKGRGETLLALGKIYHDLSQWQEAYGRAEGALALAKEVGDRRLEMATLPLLGNFQLYRGALAQAEETYQETLSLAKEVGDKRLEGSTLYLLGNVKLNQGEMQEAEGRLKEAISLFQEMGNRRGEAWTQLTLGMAQAREGNTAGGQQLVSRALDMCQEIGDKWAEPWCLRTLGEVCLAQGDLVEGEKHFQEALAKSLGTGNRGILPELYRGLAEALLGRGEASQALQYAQMAREAVTEEDVYSQATTWRVLGMALLAQGKFQEAENGFQQSVAVLENTGFVPELAKSYREYARYLERMGREEEAKGLLERAQALGV